MNIKDIDDNDLLKIYNVIVHRLNAVANMINNAYEKKNALSPGMVFSCFIVEDEILFALFKCYDNEIAFKVRITYESYAHNTYYISVLYQDNKLNISSIIKVLLRKTKHSNVILNVEDFDPIIISAKCLSGHENLLYMHDTIESLCIEHDLMT